MDGEEDFNFDKNYKNYFNMRDYCQKLLRRYILWKLKKYIYMKLDQEKCSG